MTARPPSSAGDPEAGGALDPGTYAALFEGSVLPTVAIDHERRAIIQVNRAALDFLGLDASQVLGRPANDFLAELEPDQLARIRALRGQQGQTAAAIRNVTTALGVRTVEISIVPSGSAGVAFVQAIDLTELVDVADAG